MNRKSKAKILLGTFIVSGALSQMSSISPLYAMVTDYDTTPTTTTAATPSAAAPGALVPDEFPLHTAALNGNLEQLKDFISRIEYARDRDKAINTQDSNGNTVLHCAIFSKNVELIKWLCEHYDFDPAIKNNAGFTPLDFMNSIEQEFIIKLAQNYPELAKAQSSERPPLQQIN